VEQFSIKKFEKQDTYLIVLVFGFFKYQYLMNFNITSKLKSGAVSFLQPLFGPTIHFNPGGVAKSPYYLNKSFFYKKL